MYIELYFLFLDHRCIAAVYNSKTVMQLLFEAGANPTQITSSQNHMLHIMIARASVGTEDEEKEVIHTIQYIKDIVTNETYGDLLHAENSEGLRPLELAAHLGTFQIFKFLFETPDVYMTEVNHDVYSVQYFDITEYIIGKRVGKSPVKAMLYLEERKLALKSTQMICQEDSIRCWFSAMLYGNIPVLVLWFFARFFLIGSIILMDMYNVCLRYAMTEVCFQYTSFEMYTSYHYTLSLAVVVIVLISVADDIINAVCYMCCRPRWLYRTVFGKKVTCVRYKFYVLIHSVCVFAYALSSVIEIGGLFFLVAFGFVWSFLFFMQLLPMFGNYVVATQRMIGVFVEFSLLFGVFYLSYCFTLYKLLFPFYGADFADIRLAAYNTFLVMQNMFAFKAQPEIASDFRLHLLHITFVLMVPILLLNFLIALLISTYTYVNENRDVLMTIQKLSVAMAAEGRFTVCLAPLRNCLRRKYLVYEGGRVYIPRSICIPREKSQYETPKYHWFNVWMDVYVI